MVKRVETHIRDVGMIIMQSSGPIILSAITANRAIGVQRQQAILRFIHLQISLRVSK